MEASQEIQVKNPRARVDCRKNFLLNDGKKSWSCGRCVCVCVCVQNRSPFSELSQVRQANPRTAREKKKKKRASIFFFFFLTFVLLHREICCCATRKTSRPFYSRTMDSKYAAWHDGLRVYPWLERLALSHHFFPQAQLASE